MTQGATDGAIARYYTGPEWRRLCSGLFEVESIQVYGLKTEVVPLPHSRVKQFLEDLIADQVGRFLTHNLRGGSFLVAHMRKA